MQPLLKGLLSRTFQFFLKLAQLGQSCLDYINRHRSMDSVVTIVIATAIVTIGVALIGYLIQTLRAHPNNTARQKALKAQTKWGKAK